MAELSAGDIVWVAPDAVVGREQGGRRPAIVVSGTNYLEVIDTLAIVVPVTSVARGWSNHVPIEGGELRQTSYAMTEQVRTVSRERIVGRAGRAAPATLDTVRVWLRDFLEL